MPDVAFKRLIYRGNFALTRRVDYGGSLLGTKYAGGYREDVIVGSPNGLRSWTLNYTALNSRVMVQPKGAEPKDRLSYVWDFIRESKGGGNLPFILTDPEDGKDYLAVFTDDLFEVEKLDLFLSTTGLNVEQVYVRGVNTLDDGSLGEATNSDEI